MPINNLSDLRAAVSAAVNSAASTVSAPVPDGPATINPQEEFTFSVTATNTGANAIKLLNVIYHISVSPSTVGQLKVPQSALWPARASSSETGPWLAPNSFVSEMYIFPQLNRTLDAGGSYTLSGLKGKGTGLGEASIHCHIHADPDVSYLFPKNSHGADGDREFHVV